MSDPTQAPPITLGTVARALARAEIGVRETGLNSGPKVDGYAPRCLRHGGWIAITGTPWCARFVSEMTWRAWAQLHNMRDGYKLTPILWSPDVHTTDPYDPPFTLRAAVYELVRDARKRGRWQPVQTGVSPVPGDVLVWGRNGQDPTVAGLGHCGFFDGGEGEGFAVCGNDGDSVRRVALPHTAGALFGWISLTP